MSDPMDDRLRTAGQDWRASEPPSTVEPQPQMFDPVRSGPSAGGRLLRFALAAGTVVLVIVVLAATMPRTPNPIIGQASTSPIASAPAASSSARVTGEPTPSPSSTPPSQSTSWTLLATQHVQGWEAAYKVDLAKSDDQWRQMWTSINPDTAPPPVDFSKEIVAEFADGVGSSCPDLQLDDVVIDQAQRRVYPVDSNPLGNVPCTADLAGAVVFLVAIDRSALPQSPFFVGLTPNGNCSGGVSCPSLKVDLGAPATTPPSVEPVPTATEAPPAGLTRFEGQGFFFDYPSDWRSIATFEHCGREGPTIFAVVGIGDYDPGWHSIPNGTACGPEQWTVPNGGIVLVYGVDPYFRPWPSPSLLPGEQWVEVDGRPAVLSQTDGSMRWQFPGIPEYIEVRWGAALASAAPDLVGGAISSWHWSDDAH